MQTPLPLCLRDLLFRIEGPPATSTSVSVFLVPSGRVLYPRPTPSRPCRSLAAVLVRLGSSGKRPRPIIALRDPFCLPFQSPYGLASCRLLALIGSPAPEELISNERDRSHAYEGRSVFGWALPPEASRAKACPIANPRVTGNLRPQHLRR